MKIKRVIFWAHLCAGVLAGLVIFSLSLSGVLLTYERQIISLVERSLYVEPTFAGSGLPADRLVEYASEALPDARGLSLVFARDERAPVSIQQGRNGQLLMDPYSGEVLGEGAVKTRTFFRWMTSFHRWFALDGENRDVARTIVNASNLVFLFIILSGLYLWLPRVWKWPFFRMHLFFKRGLPNAKARDYNWHHVFGIWSLIPLFFIILTGAVFYYPWANAAVYKIYGEEVPARGGPGGGNEGGNGGGQNRVPQVLNDAPAVSFMSLDALLQNARSYDQDWRTLTLAIPNESAKTLSFTINTGTGGEPTKITTIELDRANGALVSERGFSDASPGQQTRSYVRRLHTGESLGLIGQTIAGLASLGACVLVYTGLALAYRRLIQPALRRRKSR